jgi:hypothetical protein
LLADGAVDILGARLSSGRQLGLHARDHSALSCEHGARVGGYLAAELVKRPRDVGNRRFLGAACKTARKCLRKSRHLSPRGLLFHVREPAQDV